MEAPMVDNVHALAFEEAKRAITQQQAALDSLRTRAAVLFSASAIAVSLFGVVEAETAVRAVSLVLFLVIGCLVVAVARPRGGWTFSINVEDILEKADADPDLPIEKAHRNWALHMQRHWDENQRQLDELMEWYEIGCWVFLVLVGWSATAAFLPAYFLIVAGLVSLLGLARVRPIRIRLRALWRWFSGARGFGRWRSLRTFSHRSDDATRGGANSAGRT